VNRFWIVGPCARSRTLQRLWVTAALLILFSVCAFAQTPGNHTIHGTVVDASGRPVDGASVVLQPDGSLHPLETRTDASGAFAFTPASASSYRLSATKAALHSRWTRIDAASFPADETVHLTLDPGSPAQAQAIKFSDQPNFSVAGVTDWTAVGGHGSDTTLRTSEELARETAALKSAAATGDATAEPMSADAAQARERLQALIAHGENAGLHRQLAELDEKSGDPLAAVHEYEQAVRLDPSEQNYFAWGSELLLHRAVWQAVDVFKSGNRLHPGSPRLLTALGSALFAGDLFADAAASLCAASDLQPAEDAPYTFMGRVAIAAPAPLPCVETRLARFAQQQPGNAMANYFYAMALRKRQEQAADPVAVEQVRMLLKQAVAADPHYAEAYLQLGILAAAQHRSEEAIQYYAKAIEADPQCSEAHYRLGVTYDRNGAPGKARQEFRLHEEIDSAQAAAVERQRREVKQFLVVLQGQPVPTAAH
jgi:tetratricopeptide (TPR) repeat protein